MSRISPLRIGLFFVIATAGVLFDLASKNYVFEWLGRPRGTTGWIIDGWFKFRLYTTLNHGALWGLGQGMTWLFAILSVLAIGGVLYWLFAGGKSLPIWTTIALALITAGALGNLWDRLGMHGITTPDGQPVLAVRDFLHCRFGTFNWAIFNFADVFLVTAFLMLVVQSIFFAEPTTEDASASEPSEPVSTTSS